MVSSQRSKNFSSRRDLKELIFVDQRAYAANIDFLTKENGSAAVVKKKNQNPEQQRSPAVQPQAAAPFPRTATNHSAADRQSSH